MGARKSAGKKQQQKSASKAKPRGPASDREERQRAPSLTGSDAIDQIVGTFLERPVEVRWDGSLADAFRGRFEGARITLDGVATAWLPLERLVLSAREARIVPGLPGRLEVVGPSAEIVVSQAEIDPWMERLDLPFSLHLEERGLLMKAEVAGLPLGEIQAQIEIVRGWFVVRPRRAALLGVPQYLVSLLRAFLPVPPISPYARLDSIEHEEGRIRLRVGADDFDEDLTPGIGNRIRARLVPGSG